jgi:hypothetical protein
VRVAVPPTDKLRVFRFKSTPVTEPVTVTALLAVLPPSTVLTVMVAFPAPTAVTTPLFTVATPVLLLDHVTFLFVAFVGVTVAVRVAVAPPTARLRVDGASVTPVTETWPVLISPSLAGTAPEESQAAKKRAKIKNTPNAKKPNFCMKFLLS